MTPPFLFIMDADSEKTSLDASTVEVQKGEDGEFHHHHYHHHHHHHSGEVSKTEKHKRHYHKGHYKRVLLRMLDTFAASSDQILFWSCLLFIILFPLAGGGGYSWGLPLATSFFALSSGVLFFSYWWRKYSIGAFRSYWGFIFLLVPLLMGLFQMFSIDWVTRVLSPNSWGIWHQFSEVNGISISSRISVAPVETLRYCRLLFICLAEAFLLVNLCRERKKTRFIIFAVVIAAFVNAVYAVYMIMTGNTGADGGNLASGVARGSFFNRNHFGFMMGLGTFSALALLLSVNEDGDYRRENLIMRATRWESWRLPIVIMLFLIVATLIYSLSRGAFLSVVPVTMALLIYWAWVKKRHSHSGISANVIVILVLLIGGFMIGLPVGLSALSERYKDFLAEGLTLDARWIVWCKSMKVVRDFWFSGAGLGSFESVFQRYSSEDLFDGLINNAHNDWIEAVTDLGLPICVFLIWFVFRNLKHEMNHVLHLHDKRLKWLCIGAFAATVAGALHEFTDYNLRAPANALLFMACLCVIHLGTVLPKDIIDARHQQELVNARKRPTTEHWSRHLLLGVAAILILGVLPWSLVSMEACLLQSQARNYLEMDGGAWSMSKNDYYRIIDIADKAISKIRASADAYQVKAVSLLNLSTMMDKMEEADTGRKKEDYLRQALDSQLEACKLYPLDGYYQMFHAKTVESVANSLKDDELHKKVLPLYEYACQCRAALSESHKQLAEAYLRFLLALLSKPNMNKDDILKADEIRKKAIDKYLSFLEKKVADYRYVFDRLYYLDTNLDVINSLDVKTYDGNKALLEFDISHGIFDRTGILLKKLEDYLAENESCSNGVGKKIKSVEAEKRYVADMAVLIPTLQRKWSERDIALEKYWKTIDELENASLERMIGRSNGAKDSMLGGEIQKMVSEHARSFNAFLLNAEIKQSHGKAEEAVNSLLPFVYAQTDIPVEKLEKAFKYLGGKVEINNDGFFSVRSFVQIVLDYKLWKAKSQTSSGNLSMWANELSRMEGLPLKDSSSVWIQAHLVNLYEGKIQSERGLYNKAAETYKRGLQISENNLYLAKELAELPEPFCEKLDWFAHACKQRRLACEFNSGIVLWGFSEDYKAIGGMHERYVVDFSLLCVGDTSEDFRIQLLFSQKNGTIFSKSYSFGTGSNVLCWQVGQLYPVQIECQPMLDAFQYKKNRPEYGWVFMSVGLNSEFRGIGTNLKGKPTAKFPIFEIK